LDDAEEIPARFQHRSAITADFVDSPSVTTKLHGKKEKVVSDNGLPVWLLHLD